MSIKSVCITDVVSIEKGATLRDVALLMQEKHVGSVLVTEGSNGKRVLAGIITDRDVALTLGSFSKPQEIKVEQIMQSKPVTTKTSDGIYETVVKMREYGVKRLPVLNTDGSLYGIVCADDFLTLMGDEIQNLSQISSEQMSRERGMITQPELPVQF